MHVRIFTLQFDDLLGGFDDAPLQNFIRDKEVIAIRDHFFTREWRPFLALVVTYNLMRPPDPTDNEKRGKKAVDAAWRSMLSPEDYPLFNTLREWRSERCKEDGIPPYVICTNKQLAAMVKQMPQSLAGLGEIEGKDHVQGSVLRRLRPAK